MRATFMLRLSQRSRGQNVTWYTSGTSLCLLNILSEESEVSLLSKSLEITKLNMVARKLALITRTFEVPSKRNLEAPARDINVIKHCDVTSPIIIPSFPECFYMEIGSILAAKNHANQFYFVLSKHFSSITCIKKGKYLKKTVSKIQTHNSGTYHRKDVPHFVHNSDELCWLAIVNTNRHHSSPSPSLSTTEKKKEQNYTK